VIEARQLSKRFGSVQAASQVSFIARDGEITGLLGANGAGKSTSLRMIYGVVTPDDGQALIDGIDIRGETSLARSRLGVLPHAAGLYGNLTARENIAYFGALQGLDPKHVRERCAELGVALDMQSFLDRRAKGFSQGQLARSYTSRAISCSTNPRTASTSWRSGTCARCCRICAPKGAAFSSRRTSCRKSPRSAIVSS
jgi:sodium transport system ATP-binding protein